MIIITHERKNFILWDRANKKKIEVEAKRISGQEWRGLCPFHADREHPNLDINDLKRMYICRACGASGHLWELGFTNPKKIIEEIYDYKDEKGELIYQVVRYQGKDFKQRRPDGKGGWIWNLKGVKRLIYNLPEILEKRDKPIFIFEGEKDCNNSKEKLGILSTTNSGGCGKWIPENNKHFKDRNVIISPDKDDTGEGHLQVVGKNLMGIAKKIQFLRLPGLKKGEDISDWLEQGGDLEKLFALVKTAPEFIPQPEEEKKELGIISFGDFRPTDLWNSENFFQKYKGQLLFCKIWNSWLIYQEGRWQRDDKNEAQELGKKVIMGYYRQVSEMIDDQAIKSLAKQALRSQSQRAIKAMIELATSSMAVVPKYFDKNIFILNLKNGTMDLQTMEFKEHKASDMLMKITGVNYQPRAECPKWKAFLNKIFEGNSDLINYMQTALGYSLTGDIGEQCWFILYGIGANGKTTFMNVVQAILGDYAINSPFETFLSKGKFGGGIPNDLARMKGARFVSASEAGENRRFNEELLKNLMGSEKVTARFLRQEYFSFAPECKVWLASNYKPLVKQLSSGFWRKVRLVNFKMIIPEEERILNYDKILLEEKEGIFNWMLEGCKRWKEEKLKTPEEVIQATAQYRSSMDILAEFFNECCNENRQAKTTTKELYKKYDDWCKENKEEPIKSRVFGRRLEERGYRAIRIGGKGDRGWGGIELKDKEQELPY